MKLRQAITLLGEGCDDLLAELLRIDNAVSLLDYRRYDAESRRADAISTGADPESAEREVASLIAEHRDHVEAVTMLRDRVLIRLDQVFSGETVQV